MNERRSTYLKIFDMKRYLGAGKLCATRNEYISSI